MSDRRCSAPSQAYPGQSQQSTLGASDKQNLAYFCWTNFFWQWNDCMNVRLS